MNARTALTLIAAAATATGAFAQGPTLPPGLAPPSPPSATQQGNSATAAPKDACSNCATIMTIQMTTERQDWTPLGTVAPGSVGIAGAGVSEGRTAYVIGSVSQSYEPLFREGDRVRVFGTQLELINP
jgi:hypothetical protein